MALPRSLATTLLGRQSRLLSTQLHANSAASLVGDRPIARGFASESGEETFDFEVRAWLITFIKGSQPASSVKSLSFATQLSISVQHLVAVDIPFAPVDLQSVFYLWPAGSTAL